jgi:hypothetical protein
VEAQHFRYHQITILGFGKMLSINVPPNHSRSAINGDGWIASSHTLYDQKGRIIYRQIVTDAVSGTPCPETEIEHTSSEERIPSIPVFIRETLITMAVEQLKEICRRYNIKTGKTKEIIVDNILKSVATVHRSRTALETLRMRTKTTSTPAAEQWMRGFFLLPSVIRVPFF